MALTGIIRVPSDKSISHRAVLFAGLAKGTSTLQCVLPSADVCATINAIKALGAHVEFDENADGFYGEIKGIGLQAQVDGPVTLDCGNSGTTTRLFMGVLSGLNVDVVLIGDASLTKRPMMRVIEPLQSLGAHIDSVDGHLPVHILPVSNLHNAQIITQQASAQVKSAVLLAGMQASGITSVTEPSKSRDHTELLLPAFGVDIDVEGLTCQVTGPVCMHSHNMAIPGDPSSAAFIAVAAALISGSDVVMKQVALNSTRTGAFEVLKRMGCNLEYLNVHTEGSEPVGDVHVAYTPQLYATVIEAHEIPTLIDEIPILAIAAACAQGETIFEACSELRVKESDRLSAIIDGLSAIGIRAYCENDNLHIVGNANAPMSESKLCFPTYDDHRLAMTWYLASMIFDISIELDNEDCVCVSWPNFFNDIDSLIC